MLGLNELAWQKCDELAAEAERLNVAVSTNAVGTRIVDCGVKSVGGLEAGRRLAEICLADCGHVGIGPATDVMLKHDLLVTVRSDQPVMACLAAQYAGWQITGAKYFAMGSGPMRAAGSREPLFEHLGYREKADRVVGVLESSKLPTEEVCERIAKDCGVTTKAVTLLVARTASMAGTVQIVARTVETALHKLHTIGYGVK